MIIKSFALFENLSDTDVFCSLNKIEEYTINKDGSIDVNGNVSLTYFRKPSNIGLRDGFPVKFRNVEGSFICDYSSLSSLNGCPEYIGGDFSCSKNFLKSLEGGPKEVGGHFYCNGSQLETLEGSPSTVRSFLVDLNNLKTLKGCPSSIQYGVGLDYNPLESLKGLPDHISGSVYCRYSQLKSLEGCPSFISGDFCINDQKHSKTISLIGFPKSLGGKFYCSGNKIFSFKGIDNIKREQINCDYTPAIKLFNINESEDFINFLNEYDVVRDPSSPNGKYTIISSRLKQAIMDADPIFGSTSDKLMSNFIDHLKEKLKDSDYIIQ